MNKLSALLLRKIIFTACFFFSFSAVFAQNDSLQNAITISYEHVYFDKQFANDWRVVSLEYKRRTGMGTLLGRLSGANRFQRSGWLGELEAYPVISKKLYAFAGIGFSNDVPVFAQWRTGSTLYYNFAKGWEAEGGFRFLYFDRSIWMGTAGMSKYVGAWLLNARSFFSIHAPFSNQSFFVKAQRYLKNEKDYVWMQVGSGVSPDESRSIQLNTAVNLVSNRVNAGARLSLSNMVQAILAAGYARDEYREKTFGNQFNGSVGVNLRF